MGWEHGQDRGAQWVSATDLRHLVDGMPDPMLVADVRGLIRFANAAAALLLEGRADNFLGTPIPFSPDDARIRLKTQGKELDLQLRWARTHWEGNPAWLVVTRPAHEAPATGRSNEASGEEDPSWERRAIQAELRNEQLQEQLHRLQEQLTASDDLRHEQQILLEQRHNNLSEVQEQLDYHQHRARQLETRAQEAESIAIQQWDQSEENRRLLEQRLQATVQQLTQSEEACNKAESDLREATSRVGPPTQMERQLEQAKKRFAEQLQRIQTLEAELERLRERAVPRDEAAWDDMRSQVATNREQAFRAEQRVAQLEQRLFDQEQKARESEQRSEVLAVRLTETEQDARQTRQGLEQQLEHLSAEEREAKRLAFEDQLTQLPNLNILQQYLDFTTGLVQRDEGAAILLLVDIDRLRSVNTTLGTLAGDELLRQFASRLKGLCRNTDVLGRRGDDEFLVVVAHKAVDPRELSLARTTVAQMAQSLASKILATCHEPFQLEGSPVQVSCSIGMTMFGDDTIEQILEQAQVALDRAREVGRARFQFFGPELQDRLRKRHAVVPRLVEALERQEFVLHYQPAVDLRTGKMVGLEALLRWNDPNLGLLEPGEFLAAAESSGLIVQIGEWSVQEACLMAAQHRDLFVSVNLSARQLMHGDFSKRFMKAIERARVKPEKIVVEISEATTSADPERVSQVLAELARWNVGLAIDDFGTGSSNLMKLQREKPRFLKIDHTFVNQLPDDKTSFHIVLAACNLAANLQMQSLAEGVEKDAQLQNLRKMGCNLAQGRLLSPPVGAAQIKEMLKRTWKLN
ncbi:EAL domain-containing protein [bacterium]|nr:EAL domain-containing protein [bacterium]